LGEGGRAGQKDDQSMKYMVKLKKTVTLECVVEVSSDDVVNAMGLAEEAMIDPDDEWKISRKESNWAVASVQTKEEQ
jgi:hypothetical protein